MTTEERDERAEIDAFHANLIAKVGQTWNTPELQDDYDVVGFCAPYVVVVRKSDGQKGSLEFTHRPRFYFGWTPDSAKR